MDAKVIPLTQGHVAIVDAEDYERLAKHKWYADRNRRTFYAKRHECENGKIRRVYMHREVLPTNDPQRIVVDHINEHGLDNRRANLRPMGRYENAVRRQLREA